MMGMSPFVLCVIVLVALASIGLPIGLSMIGASILYLIVAHLDPGTAAEQILNGLYSSYVLLAVPAVHPRSGPDEYRQPHRPPAQVLPGAGRPLPRRPGHVNVVSNVISRACRARRSPMQSASDGSSSA